jgi:NTE family protein
VQTEKNKLGIVFSSGFFGFFAHAGFLCAARELGLDPVGYAGASSGAIIAAMAASGMSDAAIKNILTGVKKSNFWDPDPWHLILAKGVRLFRGYTGYLNGNRLANLLATLPVSRFNECEKPLAVSATNLTSRREAFFTEGNLVKAVHASCAVPVLFKPVRIKGAWYLDGGMVNKAPVKGLADLVGLDRIVVHFIGSENLQTQHAFLEKSMTPLHIHSLAVNIARHEAYRTQLELVRARGIDVIEIKTNAPPVGPDTLKDGLQAYHHAKMFTRKILRESAIL